MSGKWSHDRDCKCQGLDGLCPARVARAEARARHEELTARSRAGIKRLQEPAG